MLNYKRPSFWVIGVTIMAVMFISVRLMTNLSLSGVVQKDTLKTAVVQSPNSIVAPIDKEQTIAETQLGTQFEVIYSQVTPDLEQSISNAILSSSAKYGMSGVATGEGHITLQTIEKDGITYTHILERYAVFGFENGILTVISGHANPALLSFQKDSTGNYILEEHLRSLKDEIDSLILELFPESEVKKFSSAEHEKIKFDLDSQIEAYGKAYLEKIGSKADLQISLER